MKINRKENCEQNQLSLRCFVAVAATELYLRVLVFSILLVLNAWQNSSNNRTTTTRTLLANLSIWHFINADSDSVCVRCLLCIFVSDRCSATDCLPSRSRSQCVARFLLICYFFAMNLTNNCHSSRDPLFYGGCNNRLLDICYIWQLTTPATRCNTDTATATATTASAYMRLIIDSAPLTMAT